MKRKVIDKLKALLKKKLRGNKFDIVGSYIRGNKNPNDIDIVILLKNMTVAQFKDTLKKSLKVTKMGKGIKRLEIRVNFDNNKFKIDFWITRKPEEYLFKKFAYSGSVNYNIVSRVQARRNGYKLNDSGLYKGRKRIVVKNERQLFKLIGRTYKPYKDRV